MILANSCASCVQIGELYLAHVRQYRQLVEIVADGFLLPQDFFQSVQNHDTFSETTGGHIVALAHMGLCCFLAYRFQILCCYSDAELFVFFHVSSVSVEVGVGCCPHNRHLAGQPGHRRLAKCDAGSFVGTSSISLAPAAERAGLVHSAAPPLKIAIALLDCDFVLCTSVQRGLFLLCRAHTRCRGRKPHTAATRASRRRTVPAVEGCKDANRSRRYPLTLLLRQAPEPLVGAALRKNAEISLCNFQRPL